MYIPSKSTTIPLSRGTGHITVMPDRTVSGSIKIFGLVPTVAHIHEGAVGKKARPSLP
jgi:hypothetical protein